MLWRGHAPAAHAPTARACAARATTLAPHASGAAAGPAAVGAACPSAFCPPPSLLQLVHAPPVPPDKPHSTCTCPCCLDPQQQLSPQHCESGAASQRAGAAGTTCCGSQRDSSEGSIARAQHAARSTMWGWEQLYFNIKDGFLGGARGSEAGAPCARQAVRLLMCCCWPRCTRCTQRRSCAATRAGC